MALHIVILAAGKGKRMRSTQPKVLQPLAEQPLLAHVLDSARALEPRAMHVVYGHGGEQVREAFADDGINWVLQEPQLGTGHAVAQALPAIPDHDEVLVLYGDVPLMQSATLQRLVGTAGGRALALLTVQVDDATGYGRILRDASDHITGIVEHADATDSQRAIREINTGLLCAPAALLRGWLARLDNDNAQGEYYLTDCTALAANDGVAVVSAQPAAPSEVHGINDKPALAQAERLLQQRRAAELMARGLTLRDPARFDVRGQLRTGNDCLIDVNCVFEGAVELGADVHVGPNCTLKNCRIGDGTHIQANTVIEDAVIGRQCSVGPFARLRPATRIDDRSRIGNFVETKKITLGTGSKINHLSYVGDARVGRNVNIGAGVITCNYDGARKHVTEIGDHAFIGSDVQLVAPVEIGTGATIGAGSTITRPAPDNQLTLSRTRQFTIANWIRPQKNAEGD